MGLGLLDDEPPLVPISRLLSPSRGLYSSTIFFPHYLINYTISGVGVGAVDNKVCRLVFSTLLSEIFLTVTRIQRQVVTNVHTSSCKAPVILVTV